MRSRILLVTVIALVVLFSYATCAMAEEPQTTTPTTQPTDTTVPPADTTTPPADTTGKLPNAMDAKMAAALSKTYGTDVTAQAVADLRATNLGYGEISKAFGFAALSGKPVGDIVGLRQTTGWGDIAKQLDVKVSDVTSHDNKVQEAFNDKKNEKDNKSAKQGDAQMSNKSGSGPSNSNGRGDGSSNSNGGGHGNGGGGSNGGGAKK